MDWLASGLALLGVVATIVAYVRHRPRVDAPPGDSFDVVRRWGLQVLYGFGFFVPFDWFLREPPPPSPEVERMDAQLVLATTDDTAVVLDCWVYPEPGACPPCEAVAVPLTLRAHPVAGRTPPAKIGEALTTWVTRGTTVGIVLTEEGGEPVLRISDAEETVSLAFDRAVG